MESIILARQCMDFQGLKCNNKDCINTECPLNKVYNRTWKKAKEDS